MNHESKNKNLWSKVGGSKMSGLYRYEPSGMHFARVRVRGQLVRRKLDTTDVAVARRKLADFRRDLERTDATKGNTSFAAVLDDYSATLVGAQSTLEDKRVIIAKLTRHCSAAHRCRCEICVHRRSSRGCRSVTRTSRRVTTTQR